MKVFSPISFTVLLFGLTCLLQGNSAIAQGRTSLGFYAQPVKSYSSIEVTESIYNITSSDGSVFKFGMYLDYKIKEKWHIQVGGGHTKRRYGILVLVEVEPNHWNSYQNLNSISDPEFFATTTYYPAIRKISPYLKFGFSYFHNQSREETYKDSQITEPLNSIIDEGVSQFNHLSSHGYNIVAGSGVSIRQLQLGVIYTFGLNPVEKKTWPDLTIMNTPHHAVVYSKGTSFGINISYAIPFKRNP